MKTDDPSNSASGKGTMNLGVSFVLLTAALALAFPAFAWFGFGRSGMMGIAAAAVAGSTCWLGAAIALALAGLMRGPQKAVPAVLLGMLFRMGLPLAAGVGLSAVGGPLAEAGVFGMILVFYLITLAVETGLSLRLVSSTQAVSKGS